MAQRHQAVVIGAANLAATILAMSLIDRAGRRKLLLIGSVGCAFCLAGVAWIFSTGVPLSTALKSFSVTAR